MYLKRLELIGFKSFALTTTLELGTGVTCVAGPNGAGKTNIAEAIRWVLGEQASRVIRARKTEDVIFSGSARRPALGMAEVRITLDNSDRWLPIAFEEVVVSRRAYRSGDNEYYLNQSRVRLKDITDLFLKAQVGQNSYAFMGQGLVEQVLTLRPEERRGLIEEAADVRLHRDKLNEARNRLAATRDNLERVQLVVAEIEPRLRQLERQADRASTHARLSGELAQSLQELFGRQWREAQEALAAARAACDQRQEEFDRARREVETREEGLASIASALEERRRDISEREESYRSLEEYRRDLQRRITADEERQGMLASRREELTAEIESLRAERDELARLASQHEQRTSALEADLAAVRSPDAESEAFERVEARLRELRRELVDTEGAMARASARLAEAEGSAAALADQQARLRAGLASLEDGRSEQVALLGPWAAEFAGQREGAFKLTVGVQRESRALEEARARLEQASAAVTRREDEIRRLRVDIETAQTRLEAAQATDIELPPPDAGVRAILAAGGRVADGDAGTESRIQGLVGMLGQLLRVPAGLERAIEAALDESVHAVVVETQEDALAAIELLVSEDLGRATVLPLNDIRQAHPLNLLEERGVIGVASELVRCDNRYRQLVNTLLGRTIVAQNLGIAKMLLRRGLGNVVTLDGVLLRPHGSITAGSARAIRQVFAHQRNVGELPQELDRLRAADTEATAALETEQVALADAQQTHERLAPNLDRLRAELAQAEDTLRRHRSRLAAMAARLSALHARRTQDRTAVAQTERAVAAAKSAVERAAAQAAEHTAARQKLLQEIDGCTAERESLIGGAAARATRIEALEAEQEAFRQQHTVQAASLARSGQELSRRSELDARLTAELEDVTARLEANRAELEEKSHEAEVARNELEPARHSLEQIESRQRTVGLELEAGRAHSLAAERALLEAESNVRLRDEELEALRERLSEEGFDTSEEGAVVPASDEAGRPPAWLTAEAARSDEELPPMRGGADVDATALKSRISELRADIRRLGPVNEQAEGDFAESRERYDFLTGQLSDLSEADAALQDAIQELEAIIKERFSATFQQVNMQFQRYFETFFAGGRGELLLTAPDEAGLPGVDIIAQPPRKKVRTINMLSGGERSLTAMALLFALLETNPAPICVLDEVDAALDESNVDRFTAALRQLAERTQFIIITHNRRTLEMADTIYGLSMGEDSTSTVLSLRVSDIPA